MIISKRTINSFLIFAFVFTCTLLPAESYNMKEVFLGLFVVCNMDEILTGLSKYRHARYFGLWLPIWMFFVSIIAGGSIIDSIRAVYIFTFIWIPMIAIKYDIDIRKIFLNVTYLVAILIDVFVLLHASNIMPLQSNPLAMWLHSTGNAQLSYGNVAIFYYVFFLNACPLMMFPLVNALHEGKKGKAFVVLLALMFSGTRANIYLGFLAVFAYLFLYKKNSWGKILEIMSGGMVLIIAWSQLAPTIIRKITTINTVKSFGDGVRAERTAAAAREIFGNTKTFWIGMGANVPFRANGILNYSSEMSYTEIWRIYGIISFIFVIGMLAFLLWKNRKDVDAIAYAAYLAICVVDPFLMTSTGFLMIMYMFYLYMKKTIVTDSKKYTDRIVRPAHIVIPKIRFKIM